ncbi:hypothetical protein EOPP23_20050 [Endozoicomonas sp. OPT23]|nr:hypothetical protein [Endozoicomonas sp. OPT23]
MVAAGLVLASVSHAADVKSNETRSAEISDKAVTSLLIDVSRAGESPRLVTVGDRGHILYSDDNGKNWTQSKVPTIQMLTAVHFSTAKIGYAVGHDAIVLKTEDGGETWTRMYDDLSLEAPLLDVWFRDVNNGIAMGAYGTILETTDAGKTWNDIRDRIENEEELHFNAISGDDEGNVYIIGEAGMIFHSGDFGKKWTTLSGPYQGSLFGVTAGRGEVLIHGLRGNAFRSTDKGQSWKKIEARTAEALFGSAILKNGKNILVGNSGVFVTGETGVWNSINRKDRVTLSALAPSVDGNIVTVGQGGVHLMSPKGEALVKKQP